MSQKGDTLSSSPASPSPSTSSASSSTSDRRPAKRIRLENHTTPAANGTETTSSSGSDSDSDSSTSASTDAEQDSDRDNHVSQQINSAKGEQISDIHSRVTGFLSKLADGPPPSLAVGKEAQVIEVYEDEDEDEDEGEEEDGTGEQVIEIDLALGVLSERASGMGSDLEDDIMIPTRENENSGRGGRSIEHRDGEEQDSKDGVLSDLRSIAKRDVSSHTQNIRAREAKRKIEEMG